MDTITTIKTRRAVREWDGREVPDSILNEVLDSGRYAPSPLNSQPWHFIVLRDSHTIQTLMDSAQHGEFAKKAPVVIIVTVNKGAKVDEWLSEHEQHVYAGACSIMNMWLSAWSMQLGACWVTIDMDVTQKMLLIPDTHMVIGSLALGYPKEPVREHIPEDRHPLSEMVSYEKF